jgi:hypothetical protein
VHRNAVDQRLVFLADHFGLDLARRDRVDAHADLGELDRQLAGQRRQRGLADGAEGGVAGCLAL